MDKGKIRELIERLQQRGMWYRLTGIHPSKKVPDNTPNEAAKALSALLEEVEKAESEIAAWKKHEQVMGKLLNGMKRDPEIDAAIGDSMEEFYER